MTTNPGQEDKEPQPENARPFIGDDSEFLEDEVEEAPPQPDSQEEQSVSTGPTNLDALNELRQNLFEEDQPSEASPSGKNGIFQRMSGGKKVPTQPNDIPGSSFGVKTAGKPPFAPIPRRNLLEGEEEPGDSEGTQDPRTAREVWPRLRYHDEGEEGTAEPTASDQPSGSEGEGPDTKARPSGSLLDSVRDEFGSETDETKAASTAGREPGLFGKREDRKQLPSGYDRQKQVSPYISYNPKRSLGEQIRELSGIEKSLAVLLILAVVSVSGLIVYLYMMSHQPGLIPGVVAPTQTATPFSGTPVPNGILLPGGWHFKLDTGTMVEGKWNPQTSEWLDGTEIRRDVAIPWNKQIEAVIMTFQPGDIIQLEMNNGDNLEYKVVSVSEVSASDTSILYDVKQSLAIILYQADAEKRWVVIAEP